MESPSAANTPNKSGGEIPKTPGKGKLESLPKEELLKFIRKQAQNTKDLKKKIEDLNEELVAEANENARLQEEKKEWLKQEITLEFEKKNKFVEKDNELQLAAQLGKEMLAENDDLHGEIEDLQQEHQNAIQSLEEELDKTRLERYNMQEIIHHLEEELAISKKEVEEHRDEVRMLREHRTDTSEIHDLKATIAKLENKMANDINMKIDELNRINQTCKEAQSVAENDSRAKSEQILAMDNEMKSLRKEIAAFNKFRSLNKLDYENIVDENAALKETLSSYEVKMEKFEEDMQRMKSEKEKQAKSVKSHKTKLERTAQMEEELRKQLTAIVGERDDLLRKQQKLVHKLKNLKSKEAEEGKERIQALAEEVEVLNSKNTTLLEENRICSQNLQSLQDKFDDLLIEKENIQVKNEEEMKKLRAIIKKKKKGKVVSKNDQSTQFEEIQNEETKTAILKLEARTEELYSQLQTLNEEKLSQEAELEELFSSHDDLQNKYEFECTERQKRESEIRILEEKLERYESEVKNKGETEVLQLHQQIVQLHSTIEVSQTELKKLKQEIAVKDSHFAELRCKRDATIAKEVENNTVQHSQMERIVEDFRQLDEELTTTKDNLKTTLEENNNLCSQLHELDASFTSLQEEHETCMQDCESLRTECEEKSLQLKISQEENQVKIFELQKIIEKYKNNDNNHLREELDVFKAEKNETQHKLTELRLKLQALQIENTQTKDNVSRFKDLCEKLDCLGVVELESYIDSFNNRDHNDVEVTKLRAEIQTLNKTLTSVEIKSVENETALTETKTCLENEIRMKEELLNKNNELELLLAEINKHVEELTNKNENEDELLKQLREKNVEYEENIFRLHEELKGSFQNVSAAEERCRQLSKELLLLENASSEQLSEKKLAESLREKSELESQLQESQSALEVSKRLFLERQQAVSTLEDKLVSLSSINTKLEDENHVLCEKMKTKYSRNEELNTELQNERLQIEVLNQKIDENCQTIEKLTNEINTLKEKQEKEKQGENESLKEQIELLKDENLQNIQRKDEEMEVLKADKQSLCKENETVRNENKTLCKENDTLRNETETLRNEQDVALEEQLEVLREENLNLSMEANKLNESFQSSEEELQQAFNKIDELETSLKQKHDSAEKLEILLQEKGEKGSKFRQAAIKAKKELESRKLQFEKEKQRLEQAVASLGGEMKKMKNEMVVQKTECSKHEEEFQVMQEEIRQLEEELALKQTKENESLASKQSNEAVLLQSVEKHTKENESLSNEIQELLKENEKLVTMMDELTVRSNDAENQLEKTHADIQLGEKSCDELGEELGRVRVQLGELEETGKEKDVQLEKLNKEIEELKKVVENKQKESHQMSVMNLEMEDYLKTTENLQAKLKTKHQELTTSQEAFKELEEKHTALKSDLDTSSQEKSKLEKQTKKLKSVLVKMKTEAAEEKKNNEEHVKVAKQQQETIEELRLTIDEHKLYIAQISSEKTNLQLELSSATENHLRSQESLETRHARLNNDFISAQRTHNELQQEYEQYKVRAHNVLKQQKNRVSEVEVEAYKNQIARLEEMTETLQSKLQSSGDQLTRVQSDHAHVEIEFEMLQSKNIDLQKEITQQELKWRQRLDEDAKEQKAMISEKEKEIQLLTEKHQHVIQNIKEELEAKQNELEEQLNETNFLKEKLKKIPARQEAHDSSKKIPARQESHDSSKNELTLELHAKTSLERQEGEGMDSKELEMISQRSSTVHTPISPTSSHVLESILSPHDNLFSPTTPGGLREEVLSLRTSVACVTKKNEHITQLLRESETNACRLDDQSKVLKEEIRRLERNVQREEAGSNLEYLKNVIIKFLQVGTTEREQLIPVLCTMLKLSNEEKYFMSEYAKGGESNEASEQTGSWSSYMYRWTGVS